MSILVYSTSSSTYWIWYEAIYPTPSSTN